MTARSGLVLVLLATLASCGPSDGSEGGACRASCSGGLLGGCTYPCDGDLFCDERDHTCLRKPAVGEACQTPPPDRVLGSGVVPCTAGLFCREGTCAALLVEGQPCTRADQPQCVAPLWCVAVEGGTRVCLPAGGVGQRCRYGRAKITTVLTTCDASLACALDASCASDESCTKDRCVPMGDAAP